MEHSCFQANESKLSSPLCFIVGFDCATTPPPQVFPAERDLFSDLEDALYAAVKLHMERAKSLVKKDRAAAAKEVKRCAKRNNVYLILAWARVGQRGTSLYRY